MSEITKETFKFLASFLATCLAVIGMFTGCVTGDPNLTDYARREAIHAEFERDSKNIKLPNQFTIKQFTKGGNPGSSILDTVTYRTRLFRQEAIKQVDSELKRLGWHFWKKETNSIVYCKGKSTGTLYFTDGWMRTQRI